jgi:hypothetical protein
MAPAIIVTAIAMVTMFPAFTLAPVVPVIVPIASGRHLRLHKSQHEAKYQGGNRQ